MHAGHTEQGLHTNGVVVAVAHAAHADDEDMPDLMGSRETGSAQSTSGGSTRRPQASFIRGGGGILDKTHPPNFGLTHPTFDPPKGLDPPTQTPPHCNLILINEWSAPCPLPVQRTAQVDRNAAQHVPSTAHHRTDSQTCRRGDRGFGYSVVGGRATRAKVAGFTVGEGGLRGPPEEDLARLGMPLSRMSPRFGAIVSPPPPFVAGDCSPSCRCSLSRTVVVCVPSPARLHPDAAHFVALPRSVCC